MGLIKAALDSVGGVMADQWREYFYCEAIPNDVLVTKGKVRVNKGRNSNNKGNDNIISNGSIVAVNEGQCMIIVDQGEIVEFCADAGEFLFDSSTEPSLFYGNLGENVKKTFSQIGKRFTFGGNTAKDQRVYYFNIKENVGNLFGTASPIPFRIVDTKIDFDLDTAVRCNGEFSFRIVDPLLFYKNVSGNVAQDYNKSQLMSMMKAEFLTALAPAFAKISAMGIRPYELPGHTDLLTEEVNKALAVKWEARGMVIVSIAINSAKIPEDDEKMLKELQRTSVFRNAAMGAANLNTAQADAMRAAASNTATGPMMAFAGMNMAAQAGGMNAEALYNMAAQQQAQQQAAQPQQAAVLGWTCSCGHADNRGKFCAECGAKKPEAAGWTCSCGQVNQGKFCANCGTKKPEGAPMYKCDKCGWEPEDPTNPPKFCPECGDVFDENDIQ